MSNIALCENGNILLCQNNNIALCLNSNLVVGTVNGESLEGTNYWQEARDDCDFSSVAYGPYSSLSKLYNVPIDYKTKIVRGIEGGVALYSATASSLTVDVGYDNAMSEAVDWYFTYFFEKPSAGRALRTGNIHSTHTAFANSSPDGVWKNIDCSGIIPSTPKRIYFCWIAVADYDNSGWPSSNNDCIVYIYDIYVDGSSVYS